MAKGPETMNQAIKKITIKTGKYLPFSLAVEEYGTGYSFKTIHALKSFIPISMYL